VLQVDNNYQITEFQEKPDNPKPTPDNPNVALASMGNYIFNTDALLELLQHDAADAESSHDFGKDVLPYALHEGYKLQAYDFAQNPIPGQSGPNTYWRDVGTLDSYWEASMDLVAAQPEFDIYNNDWPLRTSSEFSPPAKFVHEESDRRGQAFNSLVAGGVIISGGTIRKSLLSRRTRVNSYSIVENSVLFDDVTVNRRCNIRNTIIDKNVEVPEGTDIGINLDDDRARGLTVTEKGVVVIPKGYSFT
jgi:glucose-1-phosphate adenylyltransferase